MSTRKFHAGRRAAGSVVSKMRLSGVLLIMVLGVGCGWLDRARALAGDEDGAPAVDELQQMLWAFPADTETLIGVRGPFPIKWPVDGRIFPAIGFLRPIVAILPDPEGFDLEKKLARDEIGKELAKGTVRFAVQGSRRFRSSTDLGEYRYEGACLIRLETPVPFLQRFMDENGQPRLPEVTVERIGKHLVLVLRRHIFEDDWTYYLCQPDPSLLVCATDRDYLEETLSRLDTRKAERAIPAALPEWMVVNLERDVWAVRHYDRRDAESDPTSPLAGRENEANVLDDRAVGMTFSYDRKARRYEITYLSRLPDPRPMVRELFGLAANDLLKKQTLQGDLQAVRVEFPVVELRQDNRTEVPTWMIALLALGHGANF